MHANLHPVGSQDQVGVQWPFSMNTIHDLAKCSPSRPVVFERGSEHFQTQSNQLLGLKLIHIHRSRNETSIRATFGWARFSVLGNRHLHSYFYFWRSEDCKKLPILIPNVRNLRPSFTGTLVCHTFFGALVFALIVESLQLILHTTHETTTLKPHLNLFAAICSISVQLLSCNMIMSECRALFIFLSDSQWESRIWLFFGHFKKWLDGKTGQKLFGLFRANHLVCAHITSPSKRSSLITSQQHLNHFINHLNKTFSFLLTLLSLPSFAIRSLSTHNVRQDCWTRRNTTSSR